MADPYQQRRERLEKIVGSNGIAVVASASEVTRSNDVQFDFHQDPDFLYLSGFPEPSAVAVIAPGHPDGSYTLFVRPRNAAEEAWTGYRAGVDGARQQYGADRAYPIAEIEERLARLIQGREVMWLGGTASVRGKVDKVLEAASGQYRRFGYPVPDVVRSLDRNLGEMRLVKDDHEIELMREVSRLSARGHAEAMRLTRPGLFEYEIQAGMEYLWRSAGCRHLGYPSIVASGPNNCILHYVASSRRVEDGDLLLIDAAAEIDGYSADITRTFPANGKFSGPQRAIYEVVLAAIRAGFDQASPGGSMATIDRTAKEVLTRGLVELGLIPLEYEESLAMHHYLPFYFHGTGHWLGLDVHDTGAYKTEGADRPFVPGMIFTIEPGLYIAPHKTEIELDLLEYDRDEWAERRRVEGAAAADAAENAAKGAAEKITHKVPEEFLGIGVRIEDDILITESGHENLSTEVPIDVDEIEALCAETPRVVRV